MYKLGLNFSPLKDQTQTFKVFRKPRNTDELKSESKDIIGSRLPVKIGHTEYENYWVTFEYKDHFEEFECSMNTNYLLTKRFLINSVIENLFRSKNQDRFILDINNKNNRINFIIAEHTEGLEIVWLEPYFLRIENCWGFLLDFKFNKVEGLDFSRRIQVLSLSLNSIGRSNKEIFSDKYKKIQQFARIFYQDVFKNQIIDFFPINQIESRVLQPKQFICANNQVVTHQSRMRGIGPYSKIDGDLNLIFLHRETERKILATFYNSLVDELTNIFKCSIKLHGVRCTDIDDIAIESVKRKIRNEKLENCIIIVLKKDEAEDNDLYYKIKYEFCILDVPVQFINYNTLKNEYAVRDFSLQIFSKIGGVPWVVDVKMKNTLIIGLAQSISFEKVDRERKMERYYAYSIIMDNKGLFHSINIVSDNLDKSKYLENLRTSIVSVLSRDATSYSSIVLHAPFKISRDEIDKIKDAVSDYSNELEFLIIKLNQFNKYYGYNINVNSLIPYESSLMQLDDTEYLIWTEGITQANKNPTKRYSGPIHVEILYQSEAVSNHDSYLQDLINLSGMNWRAYNSKAVPLSIQYCKLVTEFVREFQVRNYPKLTEDNLKPWFL